MNLESLKEKLGDETFAQLKTYVDDITGQRDAARAESIDGRKKLKTEVETLRAVKATLFEKLGLDEDADVNDLPEVKGQAEAQKQFEQRVKKLERDLAAATAAKGEVEGKYRGSRLDAALGRALSAHDFIDAELVSNYIGGKVQWEDDQPMVKEGDKLLSLEDGVKLIAQTKPHLLKAKGQGGSGHPPGGAGSGQGQQSTMTRAEFEALSPAMRVEKAKAGVQLV